MTEKTEKKIITTHPLEDFFNMESGTTEIVKHERRTEISKPEEYDNKDSEIETDFQEIYDKAISGYENLTEQTEDIEPRYVARVAEVALQHLNTALSAAALKSKLKEHKDKLELKKTIGDGGKGNTIVVDRNELLKAIKEGMRPIPKPEEKVIDGESSVIEESENNSNNEEQQ